MIVMAACTPLFEESLWNRNQETRKLLEMVKSGDAGAQTALGQKYELGNGVKKSQTRAKKWYQRAIAQGDPLAMFLLGNMLETGALGAPDYQRAANLYILAANQGHAAAQASLARLYEEGLGVQQNYRAATMWYTRAAKQWELNDGYPLGVTFATGGEGKVINSDAIQWFQKAAGLGVAEAQFDLARAYELGNGVPHDREKALTWYEVAADQGHDRSAVALVRLRGQPIPLWDTSKNISALTSQRMTKVDDEAAVSAVIDTYASPLRSANSREDEMIEQKFVAHLASYRKMENAEIGWTRLVARYAPVLNNMPMELSQITIPTKGIFYRIEVGPFPTFEQADSLCAVLIKREAYCRAIEKIR